MAPFSPLPPLYSPHSRFLRPPSQLPSRPFSHIFGQTKPQVKRYKSPTQVLCGCSTEGKTWMLGMGLICLAIVGWLASLPAGEAFSRGVLVDFRLDTDMMGGAWDISGPRGMDLAMANGEVVSPYGPGEIELGRKRKIVFGRPSSEQLDLPFDLVVPPHNEPEAPSAPEGSEDQRPTAQMDDRGLDRPQPSHYSPWIEVGPMSAEEPSRSTAVEPGSDSAESQETSPIESGAEDNQKTPEGSHAGKTAHRTKLGRRSRIRSKGR